MPQVIFGVVIGVVVVVEVIEVVVCYRVGEDEAVVVSTLL